jgi:hypothetical protein
LPGRPAMPSAPYHFSISAARAEALFASPLQRSYEPSAGMSGRRSPRPSASTARRDARPGSRKPTANAPTPRSPGCAGRSRRWPAPSAVPRAEPTRPRPWPPHRAQHL